MTAQPLYEIRPATLNDVETIRRMQAQSWRDTYRNDKLGVTTESWLTSEKLEQSCEHLGACFANPAHATSKSQRTTNAPRRFTENVALRMRMCSLNYLKIRYR